MALLSGSILVLMWILGHDFSGHYNRLALISTDLIIGDHCISYRDLMSSDGPRLTRMKSL